MLNFTVSVTFSPFSTAGIQVPDSSISSINSISKILLGELSKTKSFKFPFLSIVKETLILYLPDNSRNLP